MDEQLGLLIREMPAMPNIDEDGLQVAARGVGDEQQHQDPARAHFLADVARLAQRRQELEEDENQQQPDFVRRQPQQLERDEEEIINRIEEFNDDEEDVVLLDIPVDLQEGFVHHHHLDEVMAGRTTFALRHPTLEELTLLKGQMPMLILRLPKIKKIKFQNLTLNEVIYTAPMPGLEEMHITNCGLKLTTISALLTLDGALDDNEDDLPPRRNQQQQQQQGPPPVDRVVGLQRAEIEVDMMMAERPQQRRQRQQQEQREWERRAALIPSLKLLKITSCSLGENDFLKIGVRHHQLETLELEDCDILSLPTGAHQQNLLSYYPCLKYLTFDACDGLRDAGINRLLPRLSRLERLTILSCHKIENLYISNRCLSVLELQGARGLAMLNVQCPALSRLTISDSNTVLPSCRNLTSLNVSSHQLTALHLANLPSLETIKLNCPILKEVDISDCASLKDTIFQELERHHHHQNPRGGALNQGCPMLQSLKLSDCSNDRFTHGTFTSSTLAHLSIVNCRNLTHLNITTPLLSCFELQECNELDSFSMTTNAVIYLALGTCPSTKFVSISSPSLTNLDLTGCNALNSLHLDCPNLYRLNTTFCSALSDQAMAGFVTGCSGLKELIMSACTSITQQGMQELCCCLRELNHLDLSYIPLQDPLYMVRCGHFPKLTELNLSNNSMVEPEAIERLDFFSLGNNATVIQSLEKLDISYLPVSNDVLADLILLAPNLKEVSANGCNRIDDTLWAKLHHLQMKQARIVENSGELSEMKKKEGKKVKLQKLSLTSSSGIKHVILGYDASSFASTVGGSRSGGGGSGAGGGVISRGGSIGDIITDTVGIDSTATGGVLLGTPTATTPRASPTAVPISACKVAQLKQAQDAALNQLQPVSIAIDGLTDLRLSLTHIETIALRLPNLKILRLNQCNHLKRLRLDAPALECVYIDMNSAGQVMVDALVETASSGRSPNLREIKVQQVLSKSKKKVGGGRYYFTTKSGGSDDNVDVDDSNDDDLESGLEGGSEVFTSLEKRLARVQVTRV
jgi:hypothetical protein